MKKLKALLLFVGISAVTNAFAQPVQGMDAYEVVLQSDKGDSIRLSSFKGKIVLLDFWASWCGPCRASNKHLAKIYPKFKDKGFEIVSVSLDEDRSAWLRAIKQDKISWIKMIDPGGWESGTVATWGLYALPTSYLIDREGRLIGMDLEGKQLEKSLKELIDK